ncbi:MAG: 30S ribosomal protein S2 [Lentisphaerae bacterium]|nr:30S ribosomal protein S2 [Lentisphaerota bacterium]
METTTPVVRREVDVKVLLEAGVHFGHQTRRWNPKMKPFIFGERNGIYIIDLAKTLVRLKEAKDFLQRTVASGRQILFVGTKKQAQEQVRKAADMLHQPYVVNRWLGGMLTNNRTIRQSVARMRKLETMEKDGTMEKLPKKEVAALRHELVKLQKNLSGVADMDQLPGAVFVVDICRDEIAVFEATRLNIPVVALVDTNTNPDPIAYPIPANDDAIRSIQVILEDLASSIRDAADEYAKTAAEAARKRAIEEAEERAKQKAAEDERRAREREAKKARLEAIAKAKAAKAAEPAEGAAEAAPATEAAPEAPAAPEGTAAG